MKKQLYLLLVFLACTFSSLAQWNQRQVLHPVNREIRKAIPVDLNDDGYTDIVTYTTPPRRICWQLNLGTPDDYGLVHILEEYEDLYDITTADYDSDGDPDIIAAVDYPARLVWFENTGDPESLFEEEALILQAELIGKVELSDINEDGWPDLSFSGLLSTGSSQPGFHIQMGQPPEQFAPIASAPFRLGIGLVENDPYFFDHPNLVNNTVDIYANWQTENGSNTASRITFDFDSSGFGDYTQLGDGDFNVRGLADINQDGSPEIMGSGFQQGIFYYTSTVDSWQRKIVYGSPLANSWRAVFQDIDNNGLTDIVFGLDSLIIPGPNYVPERLFWVPQTSSLVFSPAQPLTTAVPSDAIIRFLPIDADNQPDLFFYLNDELRPGYQARMDGMEWSPNQYFPAGLVPDQFVAGDADNDGDTDLYASDIIANTIFSFLNNGDQQFDAIHIERANFPLPVNMSGGDFNQDNQFDLLLSERRPLPDGRVFWMERQNNSWSEHTIDTEQYTLPYLFPEDMDEDGDLDIVASSGVHAVVYYPNEGNGSFGPRKTVPTSASYRYVHLEDWNGDGYKDLLIRSIGPNDQISLHLWDDGEFGALIPLQGSIFPPPEYFAPFDFTGDAKPDIVGNFASTISYWEHDNTESGSNNILLDQPLGTNYDRLYLMKVNEDEAKDLVFLMQYPDAPTQLYWLEAPADETTPDWQSTPIDSAGFATIAHHAALFSSTVSDLVTFHESDQTLRIVANGMGTVPSREVKMPPALFTVTPNPAGANILITADDHAFNSFRIFNLQGVLLQNGRLENGQANVNIGSLSKGAYSIRLYTADEKASSAKMIIKL